MPLSNSGEVRGANIYSSSPPHLLEKANGMGNLTCNHHEKKALPTHDSLLAKEDIDNSDVFLPGVVNLVLKTRTSSISQLSDLTVDFEMSKLSVCFRLIGLGNEDM